VIESNERFTDAWTNHHRFLLDVAYRLLGSYSDAEDIVQEAFSRLLRTDLDPIEDVRAWLVVVVSRLCLDQLRSARVKREAYIGPWFPEPLLFSDDAATDPADVVTMDESVRFALLVVLERMSPAERVVFVLHDVFDFPFEKIGPMVGRTIAACRQLASRARKRVGEEAGSARFAIDPAEQGAAPAARPVGRGLGRRGRNAACDQPAERWPRDGRRADYAVLRRRVWQQARGEGRQWRAERRRALRGYCGFRARVERDQPPDLQGLCRLGSAQAGSRQASARAAVATTRVSNQP